VLPDGSTQEGTLAYLRANLARHGPSGMRRDADTAMAGLSAVSPYRSTMVYTIGVSHLLAGDLQRAESVLVEALDLALGDGVTPLAALIGAERHLVALAAGDPRAADPHLDKAMAMVEDARLDSFWTSALPLAAAARASARRGELLEARSYARRAARLRPLLTHVLPVVSVQSLLQLTRAYLEIVDPAGARAALDQASGILLRRPDLGTLGAEAEDLKQRLGRITKAEEAGVSSLTAAELRLLPLLPTHLSFPQIADQLHVSPHTVKTQVTAVYRKLGVSSRSDAVERINALGVA
jgi:LuxR family maltose regulon positive regulatory protein